MPPPPPDGEPEAGSGAGEVPGVDVSAVTGWLAERVRALSPPLRFALIEGGRSNLSYRVTDRDGRSWVLRRPPLSGVLESAHDMGREHDIQAALADSPVPVPPVVGHEPDDSVIGAPFYVMEHVPGPVLRDARDAQRELDPPARAQAARSLVDVLVALHDIDPDAVGLGDLGRREDYIARQLHVWHRQVTEGSPREVVPVDRVHDRLREAVPEQTEATIVHGDYRLDNLILSPHGEVRAVLDWELCTLGEPLADLGLLMVYWAEPGDARMPLLQAPTVADGFPARAAVVDRYAERSGRDVSRLDYYVAFGHWKLACILEGVRARFAAGAYAHEDADAERFGELVGWLAERAGAVLDEAE